MKIGILGQKNFILPFRVLGIETFEIEKREDLERAKMKIKEGDFAMVFLMAELLEKFEKEIEDLYRQTLPAVLVIPGIKRDRWTRKGLQKILERALGSEKIEI